MTLIEHSPATRPPVKHKSANAADEIAGAVFVDTELVSVDEDGPPFWRAVDILELGELLEADTMPRLVYGSSVEAIGSQLLDVHAARDGTCRLLYLDDYDTPAEAKKVKWRRGTSIRNAWIPLNYPLLTVQDRPNADVEILRYLGENGGEVLVEKDALPARLQQTRVWRELGVSVRIRRPDLFLLRSNPRLAHAELTRRKRSDYAHQMRGYFSCYSMRKLSDAFGLENWPWPVDEPRINAGQCILRGTRLVVADFGTEARDRAGQTRRSRSYISIDRSSCCRGDLEIFDRIQTMQALAMRFCRGKKTWYRKAEGLANAISEMLPFLHGAEVFPDADSISAEIKEGMLGLCRWIRIEARAAGLKIPPKPKSPREVRLARLNKSKPKKRARKKKTTKRTAS